MEKKETIALNAGHVYTIGHSTREIEEFVDILNQNGIEEVADIRTVPRSRHVPHYNSDMLSRKLQEKGIAYRHLKGLGGLRKPAEHSSNKGWRNSSFRGFADYMQSPEFERNIEDLMEIVVKKRVALMCAEAVPWRCHRSLIADALSIRGIEVIHILSISSRKRHSLTPFINVKGNHITYPEQAKEEKG